MVGVLVVDDDELTRDTLRLMLEDAGYHVAEAEDGQRALTELRDSECPLVTLLDLDMPVLDGAGLLDAVFHDQALAERHAYVMLTAVHPSRWLTTTPMRECLGVPLVTKPFDVDELLSIVARAVWKLTQA